jgi:hypothetical protein
VEKGKCLKGSDLGFASITFFASLFLLCTTVPAFAGDEIVEDGVLHIRNGAQPAGGIETLELEELWRVGGEDEEILFGRVIRAVADEQGNVYLLDAQLSQVEVFSPDGEHLRTVSREGEGPGEIRDPADMLFLPDGNFGIVTRFPGKLAKLDPHGDPAGTVSLRGEDAIEGGFWQAHFGACRGGQIYIAGNETHSAESRRNRTWFISRFDTDGREQTRLYAMPTTLDFQSPVLVEREFVPSYIFAIAAGPDGRLFSATDWETYAITAYRPDGRIDRVIERAYENRRRTELETARIRGVFDSWTSRAPTEVPYEIMSVPPAVTGLQVTADSHLWVQTSRSGIDQPEGVFLTYDVFDPQGHFTKQLAVRCEGDPESDGFFLLNEDTAILIKGYQLAFFAVMGRVAVEDEDESAANMEMICYRIP